MLTVVEGAAEGAAVEGAAPAPPPRPCKGCHDKKGPGPLHTCGKEDRVAHKRKLQDERAVAEAAVCRRCEKGQKRACISNDLPEMRPACAAAAAVAEAAVAAEFLRAKVEKRLQGHWPACTGLQ